MPTHRQASRSRHSKAATRAKDSGVAGLRFPPLSVVRIGFVGVGGRGRGLLNDLLHVEGAEIKALCDASEANAAKAREMVEKAGQPTPALYTDGGTDYRRLCGREDLDLVYVATSWDKHVAVARTALRAGKHVAIEVPAATTLEECWELVDTAEQTRRHCMMLENCCYGPSELLVLNMVRQGVFGELNHGEAAYIHDLRELLFSNSGEGLWRLRPTVAKDGNLYPTHGLGPIAQYMNINRGDRFERLTSMSSPARGLKAYAVEKFGAADPRARMKFRHGDMNTSLLKTARGLTVMLQHDTISPRPYSRINLVSGTKGIFTGYPDRISFGHEWADLETYRRQYEHPLWKKVGELALKLGGHGGMDYVMNYRLIDCLRRGLPLDMDVYDAAAWSAVTELSVRSVAKGGAPQPFPDFTRGRWKTMEPLGVVS
jgi:predicted dehydrogenase